MDLDTLGRIVSVATVAAVVVMFAWTMANNERELRRKRRDEKRDQEWADRHDRPRPW